MVIERYPSAASRVVRVLAGAALALPLATGPGIAAEPPYGPAGYGAPAQEPAGGGRRLDLSVGRSVVVDLPRDAKEVFVANPAIANAVVRSTRKLFLIGVANGATSVFAMDAEGRQIAAIEVNVGRDLNVLRQTLRTAIPSGRIEVRAAGDSILLTGTVSAAGDAQQAVDIARAFVGGASSGAGASAAGAGAIAGGAGSGGASGSVINALSIAGRDQVMLKVTIVEIAKNAVKQLGVNLGGNWNVFDTATSAAATAVAKANPASNLVGFASGAIGQALNPDGTGTSISGQYGSGRGNIGGTLTALERAGVSRVLAEPTLVAISGESATFLAGGQVPIVVNTVCQSGQFCPPTVTYKDYGVSLGFTPIVLSQGRISVHVSTEVNEIDRDTQVNGFFGFRTRKQTTTVELPSGGTMVTAGLLASQSGQTINGIPGLINLPVLGALFRSRSFERRDTELMIMVTPYLAKPIEAAQVVRPDDGFQDASDPETLLFGRLNKIYGVAGPGPARGGSGRSGFITD